MATRTPYLLLLIGLLASAVAAQTVSYSGVPQGGIPALARAGDGWLIGLHSDRAPLMRVDSALRPVWAAENGNGQIQFVTSAGDALFAGGRTIDGLHLGAFVLKVDGTGKRQWAQVVNTAGQLDLLGGVATADGGIALAGADEGDSIVLRFGADGKLLWSRNYAVTDKDGLLWIRQTRDGGFLATGRARNTPWLLRLDGAGTVVWNRGYGNFGRATSAAELPDGGFIAVGRTGEKIDRFTPRIWIARVGPKGNVVWQKYVHGTYDDQALDIAETSDGKFVVSGSAASLGGGIVFLKVSAEGALLWSRARVNGELTGDLESVPHTIQPLAGGSVLASLGKIDTPRLTTIESDGATGACALLKPVQMELSDLTASEKGSYDVTVHDAGVQISAWNGAQVSLSPAVAPYCEAARDVQPPQGESRSSRLLRYEKLVTARAELQKHIQNLFLAKQFARLDAAFEVMRKQSRVLGDPLQFEEELAYDSLIDHEFSRRIGHDVQKKLLDAWVKASPRSAAAHIARAAELEDWAWRLRGSGYSANISEQGWESFEAAMKAASDALHAAPGGAKKDPYYFDVAIEIAGSSGDSVEAIAAESCKSGPFPQVWIRGANYLLPKWGGTSADYRAFAETAEQCTGARFGHQVYARMAAIAGQDASSARSHDYDMPWPRVRDGYRQMITASPDWLPAYHAFALRAYVNQDRPIARELFSTPDLDWNGEFEHVWFSKNNWDRARQWAFAAEPPLTSIMFSKPHEAPPPAPSSHVVEVEDDHQLHSPGFFVTTELGTFGVTCRFTAAEIVSFDRLRVTRMIRRPDRQTFGRAILFEGTPSVAPFAVGEPVRVGDHVRILACRPFMPCLEVPLEGKVTARYDAPRAAGFGTALVLARPHQGVILSGTPVLDDEGRVVAVAGSVIQRDGQELIAIDDVATLLRP